VKLRNKWVEVDPREWKDRDDLSVSVGLGTGNKDQQLAHIQTIIQAQGMALQLGVATPKNLYNALIKLTQNAGFKNPEEFWTDPEGEQAQMMQQQKSQQPNPEMAKVQATMQVEQMKLQAKEKEIVMNAQADQQRAEMQLQHEQVRSQNDVAIQQSQAQAQMELERWKAQLEAETALKKAQMELEAEMQIESMKAQNDAAIQMAQHRNELGGLVEKAKGSQGSDQMNVIVQGLQAAIESLNRPKVLVRDSNGKAVGIQPA
jgi:cell pole-organizing protein PopZ